MTSIDTATPAAARWTVGAGPDRRLRVGIVGCGDVAHRRYLPALAGLADRLEIVACCDVDGEAAARAAASVRAWSSAVASTSDLDAVLTDQRPDAIFNLTPAPRHAPITRAALEADAHVYSEKPIADSIADADALIALAASRQLLLLCAPASAISRRIGWLREIVESGGSVGSPWRWPITRIPGPWRGASTRAIRPSSTSRGSARLSTMASIASTS